MIMNRLTMLALHRYRLLSCLGVCLTANLYLVYAWTILGSTGLLRLLNPMCSPLLSRRGGTVDGCSSSLQGPCLVDSSVARSVQDHANYAQDIVDLWLDCGLPLTAHVDEDLLNKLAPRVYASQDILLKYYAKYIHRDQAPKAGETLHDFSYDVVQAITQLHAIAGVVSYAFTWPMSAFRSGLSHSLRKLRDAEMQDTIITNPSAPFLDRARAALTKEEYLTPLAPLIVDRGVNMVDGLIPRVDKATTYTEKAVNSGRASVPTIENQIKVVQNIIASIPRYRFWWIYRLFFGGHSAMVIEWLSADLGQLRRAEKEARQALRVFEDVLDNLSLVGRYLLWYKQYSDYLLATYHRDDLKPFSDGVNAATRAYEKLYDDSKALIWLADNHPRDLVGTLVFNRRRNQTAIEA